MMLGGLAIVFKEPIKSLTSQGAATETFLNELIVFISSIGKIIIHIYVLSQKNERKLSSSYYVSH